MVVALVLAGHAGRFSRLRMVLLLRPEKRHRLGRRLSVGQTDGGAIRKTHDSFLHWRVVRPLSHHEAHSLGRYNVYVTPTTVIADAEGNVLEQVQGAMSKSEFLAWLDKPHAPKLEP